MSTLAHSGGAAHRVRSVVAIALLALVALLAAGSASAAGATGPVDASGIPIWYQDAAGLQLAPCVIGLPNCVATLADLKAPDGEAFYWLATADLTGSAGESFTVTMAAEAANLGGLVTFGRIRVDGRGLLPNTTYNIAEPYGDVSVTSDATGRARDTSDVGCGLAPCNFDGALGSPVFGGFLRWDATPPAPPAGFIGDNATTHTVTGSPINRNSVTITGGGLLLTQNQFVVQGQLAAGATPPGMLAPPAPSGLHLAPADDTGLNKTDNITNLNVPGIAGVAEAGTKISLFVDGVANGAGTAAADGSFSVKPSTALTDGQHSITAKAVNPDPLSNAASPPSAALTIGVDTVAPAVLAAPKTASASSASFGATFTGSAEAESLVTLFADGDKFGDGTAAGGSYSIKASALGTGLHHITATATDVAGNASAQSPALSLPVGSVNAIQPPALSASSDSGVSSTDGITNVSRPTFVGSVSLSNATVKLFSDGAQIGSATTTGGAYSIQPADKLADGQHLITVAVTDNTSGLDSAPSSALKVTIDTAAPAVPSKPVAAAARAVANAAVGVSGTGETGSTVAVFVDGRSSASTSVVGGSWSATLAGLAAGSHLVDAAATDIAGNTSAHSDKLTLDVGASAPAAAANAPAKAKAQLPSVVAVGAVPFARFHGKLATVKASISVGNASQLAMSVSAPGGKAMTLLKGSRLGTAILHKQAKSLQAKLRSSGRVAIELHLKRAQLKRGGVYRIVIRASDAAKHATTLRIAFRVK
jgi:hypothetical protein